jgi:matrixin/MG2 domain-containing protein/alpha-galactosidase-like protein
MRHIKYFAALAAGAGIAALLTTAGAHAYATYAKWNVAQVPYFVNPQNMDVSSDAADQAIQTAAAAWSTQSHANVSLLYAGRTSDTTVTLDQKNIVLFRNVSNGSALATTYWWSAGTQMVDADIVIWDGGFTFYTGASGCSSGAYIEDVLTHEFGHALGMLHTTVTDATMYPTYTLCSTMPRSLASDDIAGIESLYPPITGAPSVTIASPTNGATAPADTPMAFTGSAYDAGDGDLTSRISWTSSINGPIGTGGAISALLSAGTHTITASVTDSSGLAGTKQIQVSVAPPCVHAAPTVTLSPTPTSVPAGATQSYTVNVVNNDGSGCSGAMFSLVSKVPAGWSASSGTSALSLNPSSSASTTFQVTAPVDAALQSYTLAMTAVNGGDPSYAASGYATESIVAGFTVTTATNAAVYTNGNTVLISSYARNAGLPVSNVKVTVVMTRPNGTVQRWTPTTDRNGLAKVTFKIASSNPRGTYSVNASATKNGATASASTSFVVQ